MNRSLAFTGLPLLLLSSAIAACSGAPGSSSTQPSTVSTTTSLAVGECASETAPASSGGDLDDKMTADGSCRARGLTLGSFGVSGGTATYACCKTEPTPIETDGGTIASDAGTSPPGTECDVDSLGSPTSSADPGTWKDDATKTCELRGETLSDFSVADPTGNGDYRFAKITCCEVAPPPPVCGCAVLEPGTTTTISNGSNITTAPAPLPPVDLDGGVAPPPEDAGTPPVCTCPAPPPQLCSGGGFGNANGYCTATAEAFKQAQNDCAQEGLQLTDFEPDQGSCAAGSVQGASYECCATIVAPPPPPPPPPPVCNGGGGFANAKGTCSSLADAQAQAKAACAAEGETVQDFETTQGSCPAGEIQSGSYECCSTEVVGPPIEVDAGAPVPAPAPKPISN
jgi:hypothetical protein